MKKLNFKHQNYRWEKIKQYVEIINTSDKETVLKGWEKTKLSSEFDLDESMLDKDFEEEFLLNEQMEELMLEDENSAELNDSCPDDMVELVLVEPEEIVYVPDANSKEKKQKQSRITDFISQKQ